MGKPPTFTVLEPITQSSLTGDLIAVYNNGDSKSTYRFRFYDTAPDFLIDMGLMMQNTSDDLFLMKVVTVEDRPYDNAVDIVTERVTRLLDFVEIIETENTKLLRKGVRYE